VWCDDVACQELACDACIASSACSWCRLPVAGSGLAVFGCESGASCKASFAGFGVKPLTNSSACAVSYNDLNLDTLKDVLKKVNISIGGGSGGGVGGDSGNAPPLNDKGQFIPPSQLPPNSLDPTATPVAASEPAAASLTAVVGACSLLSICLVAIL
jgi:hypothetical protein